MVSQSMMMIVMKQMRKKQHLCDQMSNRLQHDTALSIGKINHNETHILCLW